MTLPRWNFLFCAALLCCGRGAYAQQAAFAPQYRLTVWTITEMPQPESIGAEKKTKLPALPADFNESEIPLTSDADLLVRLRLSRHQYLIPRLEQKTVVMLTANMLTDAKLVDGRILKLKVPDRETALAEIGRQGPQWLVDGFRRQSEHKTLIYTETTLPLLDDAAKPMTAEVQLANGATAKFSGWKRTGHGCIKPGFIYTIGSGDYYGGVRSQAAQVGKPDALISVRPRALILYCLEQVPATLPKK